MNSLTFTLCLSLPFCYEYQFGCSLPINSNGVPLEHLVTCISNVELKCTGPTRNIKYLTRLNGEKQFDNDEELLVKGLPCTIATNLQLLCREIVDLLKTTERTQLLFSRFIPAYHHSYTKQCKVSDYGYIKLIDLLQSPILSNYIQVSILFRQIDTI